MRVPLFVGAVFLFKGAKILIAQRELKKQPSTIIPGKVVGYEKIKAKKHGQIYSYRSYGNYTYAPIFEYYYEGKVRQVSHSFSTNNERWLKNNFSMGKSIELLVYENKADNAVLNTKFGVNAQVIMATVFSIVGIILLGVEAFIFSMK